MAVPKRRVSKTKGRSRRAGHRIKTVASNACSQCGAPKHTHRVCSSCGYYRGRQVVSTQTA